MCVICIKEKGVRMPTLSEIKAMWERNPHGAGFMYARNGKVHIEKGFMTLRALMDAMEKAELSESDPLVLHFRIATQGGINPEMCHPFPVSRKLADMEEVSTTAQVGIAHNGVIQRCCSTRSKFSDTALFVTRYVSELIRKPSDIMKYAITSAIEALAPGNRFAIMNANGKISTIGRFEEADGLQYSNLFHVRNYNWWRK